MAPANYLLMAMSLTLVVITFSLTFYSEKKERDNISRKAFQESLQGLSNFKSTLLAELNKNLFQLGAFVAYISVNPDIVKEDFNIFSRNLFRQKSQVISLAAAPNLVVKYVYPFEENTNIIGLDYRLNILKSSLTISGFTKICFNWGHLWLIFL